MDKNGSPRVVSDADVIEEFFPELQGIVDQVYTDWRNTTKGVLGLTEREKVLLQYLCHGYSNSEVAEALILSEPTVKNDLTKLFAKLGVDERLNAVLWAHQQGFELGPPRRSRRKK